MTDSKATKLKRTPSEAKSKAAAAKPRVGGKFAPKDPEAHAKKKEKEKEARDLAEAKEACSFISDEDREKIGDDSMEFFKMAMKRAPTYYEGAKYAKELIARQYASLQSVQSKQELEVTTRVLRWSWEDDPTVQTIESTADEVLQVSTDTSINLSNNNSINDTVQSSDSSGDDSGTGEN